VKERLTELGIKFSKKDDDKTLRSQLDLALKEKSKEVEEEVINDPDDCFGKPHMRIVGDPDCKRCPDFVKCGKAIDALATDGKGVAANADEEALAEEEVGKVEATNLPRGPKAKKMEKASFIEADDVKQKDIGKYTLVYHNDKPEDDDLQDVIDALYKKEPDTVSGLVKAISKVLEVEDGDEAEVLTQLVEAGVIRIKK
jgi:hypothetical protein